MTDRADALAVRLRSLAEVTDARRVGDWLLVVPGAPAVRILRQWGKSALVARWCDQLDGAESARGLQWRLLEALPPPGSDAERRALQPIRAPLLGRIERTGPAALRCPLAVPLDLAIFAGHFRSIPIVPAVVQVGWAFEQLRAHLRADAQFAGFPAAKFRRLMQPGMALTLSLELDGDRARFEYCCEGAPVSTGRLQLGSAHG